MSNEICFAQKDWMFSCCIGGLLYRRNKLLLQYSTIDEYYDIPGCLVSFGEYTQATLARRLMEQSGGAVKVGRLAAVVEQFSEKQTPCHQINLYYLAELKDPEALPEHPFAVLNELGEEHRNLEFRWVDVDALQKIELYPNCLRPYLKEMPEHILHLQENRLED